MDKSQKRKFKIGDRVKFTSLEIGVTSFGEVSWVDPLTPDVIFAWWEDVKLNLSYDIDSLDHMTELEVLIYG